MIKLIIAGSRGITNFNLINAIFVEHFLSNINDETIQIISGTARGVDQLGERVASKYNIEVIRMPAKWDLHGKSAGYKRNLEMAKIATHLLAFSLDNSKGTGHMIKISNVYGLNVRVLDYNSKWDKHLIL